MCNHVDDIENDGDALNCKVFSVQLFARMQDIPFDIVVTHKWRNRIEWNDRDNG